MIICQVRSAVVAKQIRLAHLNYWEWPKSHVLLIKHALGFWMRAATRREPIASAKRVLLILARRAYTKRKIVVSTCNTTQCVLCFLKNKSPAESR